MAPRQNRSTRLENRDLWRAAVLARDNAISDYKTLAHLLGAETGKPQLTGRELSETVRKSQQKNAAPARRRAAEAVAAAVLWAKYPASSPPPDLPGQPPPPPPPAQLIPNTPAAAEPAPAEPAEGRTPAPEAPPPTPEENELAEMLALAAELVDKLKRYASGHAA